MCGTFRKKRRHPGDEYRLVRSNTMPRILSAKEGSLVTVRRTKSSRVAARSPHLRDLLHMVSHKRSLRFAWCDSRYFPILEINRSRHRPRTLEKRNMADYRFVVLSGSRDWNKERERSSTALRLYLIFRSLRFKKPISIIIFPEIVFCIRFAFFRSSCLNTDKRFRPCNAAAIPEN